MDLVCYKIFQFSWIFKNILFFMCIHMQKYWLLWHLKIFSRKSDSTIANVCSSVISQNPPTAWNHYPSSLFIIPHHPSSSLIIAKQMRTLGICFTQIGRLLCVGATLYHILYCPMPTLHLTKGCPKKNALLSHLWVSDLGRGVFRGKK